MALSGRKQRRGTDETCSAAPHPAEVTKALSIGYYHSPGRNRDYPRMQIWTVEQLLPGEGFQYPQANVTLLQAEWVGEEGPAQGRLVALSAIP